MIKNMSIVDRAFRVIVAAIVVALYLSNVITGTTATVLIAVAVVFLATSFINYCPLYSIFGIRKWERPALKRK